METHDPNCHAFCCILLQISKLLFVDLPGAERLGINAEVLRPPVVNMLTIVQLCMLLFYVVLLLL
jgi:hypothetical protein